MKVYIVYQKDGYDGQKVGGVFESRIDAENEIQKGGFFSNVECHKVQISTRRSSRKEIKNS